MTTSDGTVDGLARAVPRPGEAARRRPPLLRGQGPAVAVVALGGVIGAVARYAAGLAWAGGPSAFPWTTLLINVGGCAVIGVFLVAITEGRPAHPLLRPFFGTGVLGGFTTFSTYAVDVRRLVEEGRLGLGLTYLGLTLLAALGAVWAAAGLTRRLVHRAARADGRRS
ncbi:fluoride efflux transporter CrcB [Streptomyces kaniharaensis]|uniref:Fluoride-specific ion channel FluC n=1 Tax=Streptomyces kaniharaensis TaxID=212423 RepID=A0A6N7KRM7_9ACTN|nr:fluoride efflux transporter CrcB [Streptomyces kaniharaensis]MQS13008.1 fluoride efflux transporter CrcB [Streptomyces kaniharaensis]